MRQKWLDYHEDIKRSALATVSRYRTASAHLIRFGEQSSLRHPCDFSTGNAEDFVHYLRRFRVAANGHPHTRTRVMRDSGVKYTIWRDMGAIGHDRVRIAFARQTKKIGRPDITALKTCRHHFATSLQDANVDPFIRNELLGHSPGGLGMTTRYTQTRPASDRITDGEGTVIYRKPLQEHSVAYLDSG